MVKKFENKQQTGRDKSMSVANMIFSKSKVAFTLAEVLITLAIIGVVAAMTLPTLVQKHQKRVLATRFQQSLSILSQGFQKMMADEGVTDFGDTEWTRHQCGFDNFVTKPENSNDIHYKCTEIANKYFKVIDALGVDYFFEDMSDDERNLMVNKVNNKGIPGLADSGYASFLILNNGMQLFPSSSDVCVIIDTNGDSKPNKEGYDIFRVYSLPSGTVVPYYSRPWVMAYLKDELAEAEALVNEEYNKQLIQMGGEVPENIRQAIYEDSYNQYFNDKEYDMRLNTREGCINDRERCGAYLYENGFVMDY